MDLQLELIIGTVILASSGLWFIVGRAVERKHRVAREDGYRRLVEDYNAAAKECASLETITERLASGWLCSVA